MEPRHFTRSAWGIDERTGFLPSHPPLRRLPVAFMLWETLLDEAFVCMRTPGCLPNRSASEAHLASRWRARIRNVSIYYQLPCQHPNLTFC